MSKSFWELPIATIEKALGIRKEIEALKASVDGIFRSVKESVSSASIAVSTKKVDGRRGKRSAAARAKMAAAAKARWAKKRGVSSAAVKPAVTGAKKKRRMSAEGRARIIAAQKARWAKHKSTSPKPATKAPGKKRTMSPEGRARIAAAQKARWAKQKKAA